jgi:hypothetical protein
MSDFGDFDPDDAFDTEPPDPEQVARLYVRYHPLIPRWDDLDDGEKRMLIGVFVKLVATLRRQGAFR